MVSNIIWWINSISSSLWKSYIQEQEGGEMNDITLLQNYFWGGYWLGLTIGIFIVLIVLFVIYLAFGYNWFQNNKKVER